jgi:hypothetical protein
VAGIEENTGAIARCEQRDITEAKKTSLKAQAVTFK